jgi:hypothetical protein
MSVEEVSREPEDDDGPPGGLPPPPPPMSFKALQKTLSFRTGLKNFTKWRKVPATATTPLYLDAACRRGFVPMKLPYDDAPAKDAHNARLLAAAYPTLRRILDLQQQDSVYDTEGTPIVRERIAHQSKVIPSRETVTRFVNAANRYWAKGSPTADALLAVHCHYGFNRTGFLLVSFLVEAEGWLVDDAIAAFETCRSPGIKHEHFKKELRRRYHKPPPPSARAAVGRLFFAASVLVASTSIALRSCRSATALGAVAIAAVSCAASSPLPAVAMRWRPWWCQL